MRSKEEQKEYYKKWYQANREYVLKYAKEYAQSHKEQCNKIKRNYYANHKNDLKWKKRENERHKKWRDKNPETSIHRKNRHLKENFGITLEQFNKMMKFQDNKCAICHRFFTNEVLPYVDHDHKINRIRGLLCSSCNIMLGMAKDNADILRYAIHYLENKADNNIEGA